MFHLAQLNIARPKEPMGSELMASFEALLDPVNAMADAAPGFVWRLQTEDGNATSLYIYGDGELTGDGNIPVPGGGFMINMSVWESADALWDFVYSSDHLAVMRRRREWFEHLRIFMCLWWIPAGHIPTIPEAEERLTHLREHGPTPYSFTFKQRFPAPEAEPATPA